MPILLCYAYTTYQKHFIIPTYRSTNSSSNKTVLYLIMIGFLIDNHLRLKSRQLFESQFKCSLNGWKQLHLCLSRYRNRNINRCFINEMSSHVTQNTTCWKLVYDDGENRFIVQNSWKKMQKPWNYGKSVPSIIHGLERHWIHCSLDDFNTTKIPRIPNNISYHGLNICSI